MKNYTTKEVSELFGVSIRTVQRHIATIIDELTNTDKKGFLIPQDVVNLLKQRHLSDTTTKLERHDDDNENEEFPFVEYFTADEYEEFKKRITEYPFLKEQIENSKQHLEAMEKQIEYFRFSYNKQLEIHEKLIDTFRERNFIEAKEKGLDKP
ncbi:hypothetical protein [Epilithonimonas sp.]|uniref:hypothetical protein n=1 Tax=Epilithonimonas sp. TaxID=2894511 RepID=UPI002FDE685B